MAIPLPVSLRRSTPPNFTFTPDSFLFYFYFDSIFPPQPSPNPFQVSFLLFRSIVVSSVSWSVLFFTSFSARLNACCPSLPRSLPSLLYYSLRCPPSVSLLVCLNPVFSGCWSFLFVLSFDWYLFLSCILFSFPFFFPPNFPVVYTSTSISLVSWSRSISTLAAPL